MLKIGVKEDGVESFITDVYNRCKDIGLPAENISFLLQDLIEFSTDVIPVSKMPDYIKERIDEKSKLEEVRKLKAQVELLQKEKRV